MQREELTLSIPIVHPHNPLFPDTLRRLLAPDLRCPDSIIQLGHTTPRNRHQHLFLLERLSSRLIVILGHQIPNPPLLLLFPELILQHPPRPSLELPLVDVLGGLLCAHQDRIFSRRGGEVGSEDLGYGSAERLGVVALAFFLPQVRGS